jgi:kynureninase
MSGARQVTRLYVPATLQDLALLDRVGVLSVGDDVVVAPDESEQAEYDALMTAAELSAYLVAELGPGERRRVVIVAEAAGPAETVSLSDVVAVHADAGDVPPGVDPHDLEDLGWYATQEIPDLLSRR